jgi:hypothetical protein
VSDWQPIETAPKDGSYILGYEDQGLGIYRETQYENGRWVWFEIIDGYLTGWSPSHWMPLPASPP